MSTLIKRPEICGIDRKGGRVEIQNQGTMSSLKIAGPLVRSLYMICINVKHLASLKDHQLYRFEENCKRMSQ